MTIDESDKSAEKTKENAALKGCVLALETLIAQLIWRVAWDAQNPQKWLAAYRKGIEREASGWQPTTVLSPQTIAAAQTHLRDMLGCLELAEKAALERHAQGKPPRVC
jgi:hypothetical protein